MINLFGEVVPDEKPRAIATNPPMALTTFMLATWYSPDIRWKLWANSVSKTREEAEKHAERIGKIRGHTHYVILELRFPGLVIPEGE